jgi:hypothetical protein
MDYDVKKKPSKELAYFFQGFEPKGKIILHPIKINNEYQGLREGNLDGKPSPTRSTML